VNDTNERSPRPLAVALQELAEAYPTDDDGTAAVLTVTDPATGEAHTVNLQAGHVAWLTGLVMDETATARNTHPDGNGQCAHCTGTGRARREEETK
jgi:hypothetical protein